MLTSLHNKVISLYRGFIGEIWKKYLKMKDFTPPYKISDKNKKQKIIVSLTSYGRRVKCCSPYAIYSIFRQTILPDKLILYLDNTNWSERNIPKELKELTKYGLEIKFTEDLKSYKKLIPALKEYPEDIIITIDDDIFYSPNMIKELLSVSYSKNAIHCRYARNVKVDQHKNFYPYSLWDRANDNSNNMILPIGVGGIMYPPKIFKKQVTESNLFMNLCPQADDLWFWFMSLEKEHILVKSNLKKDYPIDLFYQKLHSNSSLSQNNFLKGEGNDLQIQRILKHFNITSANISNHFFQDKNEK